MNLIVLALILGLYLWLSIKKPSLGLGLIPALAPTYLIRFKLFGFPTTLLEALLVVFLLAALITNFRDLPKLKRLGRLNLAVILFAAAGIISTAISPDPIRALGILKAYVIEPILFFYAAVLVLDQPKKVRLPLKLLFWAATLVSAAGLIQYATVLGLPLRFWGNGEEVRRITSVFEYPNALALYLAPLFVLFVVLKIKQYDLLSRGWWLFGLAIQLAAIILTFSRGAWLAIAIVLFFALVEHFSFRKVALGAFLILLAAAATPPIRQRVMLTLHDPSGIARVDLLNAGMTSLKSNPVFGNGLNGFRTTLQQQNFQGEILNYPHNVILNFWLETGLLGLISFAMVIYYSAQKYRHKPTALGLACVCFIAATIIHGSLDVPYFKNDLALLFWFVIALLNIKH